MSAANPLAEDLDYVLEHTRALWDELRTNRIFITGATGFFGCWLLETFAWANQRLNLDATATILIRDPQKLKQQLPHLANGNFNVVVGDVRNFAFPAGNFSHLIQAATESSVELNSKQPTLMFDTIVEGTRHSLEFAQKAGTEKFLLTSSGAVYGKQPSDISHVSEDFAGAPDPLDPQSAYAEGKRAAELLCALAAKQSKIEAKIARCFAFVGPYMKLDAHFAIGNFIRDRISGVPIQVQGDGTTVRSYMYASDLMIWLWTVLFRGESCRAYNVGSEQAISIADLAHAIATAGSERVPVHIAGTPVPGAAVARYVPSTTRAQKELGLRCTVPLPAAIERTMHWNHTREAREVAAPTGAV
jgi:dTDP-glucose 4,6-dehydratase